MACLVHDAALGGARNGRTCRVPGPQAVPGILGRIQARAHGQFLHHTRHVNAGETVGLHLPVPIDRTEQWARGNVGQFQPALESADWASPWIRSIRYTDLAAHSGLIHFRSAQRNRQPVFAESAILYIQPYQLTPPERARVSEQNQSPIPRANDAGIRRINHRPDIVHQCRRLLARGSSLHAPDAFHGVRHDRAMGR